MHIVYFDNVQAYNAREIRVDFLKYDRNWLHEWLKWPKKIHDYYTATFRTVHFHNMVLFVASYGLNLDLRAMNVTINVEVFLDIITMHLVFLEYISA